MNERDEHMRLANRVMIRKPTKWPGIRQHRKKDHQSGKSRAASQGNRLRHKNFEMLVWLSLMPWIAIMSLKVVFSEG